MGGGGSVDWAALAELQAAGLSQADVQALAASGGAGAGTGSGGGSNIVTGLDSNGLPSLGSGSSPLVPNLPPNATLSQQEAAAMAEYNSNPQLQQYIQQTYGYIGSYLLSVPELLPILVSAGLENWDQGQFDSAIAQTAWYKSTSQAQRNFQEIQATNPGEAAQQVSQMQDTILQEAQNIGVTVPPDQLANLAKFAVTFGWTSAVIDQTLRAGGGFSTPNPQFGAASTFKNQATQLSGEYLINLSPDQMANYVKQNVAGTLSADGLQQEFMTQAAQMYPWMASSIKMGVTPSQYLSSYASAAGKTLDTDPSSINWTDPKYMRALLNTNPDGTQAPKSIGEFQQTLMQDPIYGYQNTQGARDQAFATAQQILTEFGKVKQ